MSALKELLEEHDKLLQEVDEIAKAAKAEERDLTEEEETRSGELLDTVDQLDGRIKEEKRREERARLYREARSLIDVPQPTDARVEHEPTVYGPDSEQSWVADTCRVAMYAPNHPAHVQAQERLNQWGHQVEREVAHGSKEGRNAEKQIRELYREGAVRPDRAIDEVRDRGRMSLEEKRAITTGGGATASAGGGGGAAFVTPVFFVSDYAPYREFGRAFADQANKQPLPSYGMDVYVPAVTGPAAVASQTEGSGVTETDPTAGYISAQLKTEAGQVTVSQQLLDRAGPGFSFDRMIFDQLQRDYAPKVDTLVLTQALAGAGATTFTSATFVVVGISGTGAAGAGSFYGKVAGAKVAVRTTAGTILNPTHLFVQPARWELIAATGDAQGRPIVVPDYAGPMNAAGAGSNDGDIGIEGRTGYRFNGLPVFTDANIPTPGTGADQAIVADMNEVWLFEGNPVTRAVPQTLAQNLQVLLQLYSYVAVLVRYPLGVNAISGTGMQAIAF